MNLQSVAISTFNAVALTTGTQQDLFTQVAVGGGRNIFRKIFGLRVTTGGLADGIRFDVGNASCNITFSIRDFDAKGGTTPQVSIDAITGQALAVTLPAPMQVRSINFTGSGSRVELYRMDGDELASELTKEFGDNGSVEGDFTDRRFGVKLNNVTTGYQNISAAALTKVDVRGYPTGARIGLATIPTGSDPIAPGFFFVIPGEVGRPEGPPGSAGIGEQLATALQQHFDGLEPPYPATVDLLLVAESDAPCRLQFSSFAIPFGLIRNSFRAVLLRPEDVTVPGALITRLREASTPFTAYLRGKLNTATQNALTRTGNKVPEPVLSNIVQQLNTAMQTEAFYHPDRFGDDDLKLETVTAANGAIGIARTRANRAILEEAFPNEIAPIPPADDANKEVLRAQGANTALAMQVDVPRPITIRAATLRLEGDLRSDSPANLTTAEASETATSPTWDAPIPDATGFSVDAMRAVATLVTPVQASEASGVAVAVSLTSTTAELIAELREDQAGIPNGRVLGSATLVLHQLDRPSWIKFQFASPVVVKAASHWIVLRATNGSALWLADVEVPGTARVGDPAPKGWIDRGQFTDRTPLYQIWTKTASLTSMTSNGKSADIGERLRVSIGPAVLTPGTSNGTKIRTVDIKDALQNLISAVASGQLVAAPIRVSALGTGNVTVYPPEIEYDL